MNIRNTTQEKNLLSPIDQLIGRKTKSILSHQNKDIYAEVHNDLKTGADLNQRTDLKPLDVWQIVRIQPLQRVETIRKERKVIERISSRSYLMKKNDGRTIRRNRSYIKPSTRATYHIIDKSKRGQKEQRSKEDRRWPSG